VEIEGSFRNNKQTGAWKYFDEKGKLQKTVVYRNGVVQSEKEK
jgi:uncharacterized protein